MSAIPRGQQYRVNTGIHTVTVREDVLRELLAGQQRIEAQLTHVLRAVELMTRGRGARDDADRDLIAALVTAIGARQFSSQEVWQHRSVDAALRAALMDADLVGARQVGKFLQRLEGHVFSGTQLRRVGADSVGVIWQFVTV